ncbi:MAG: polyphenol oxidase family protein [Rickettsiales bacterium]
MHSSFTFLSSSRIAIHCKNVSAPHFFAGKNREGGTPTAQEKLNAQAGVRRCIYLKQCHGTEIFLFSPEDDWPDMLPEADAAVTARRDVYLAVKTADCAPILIDAGDAVAVIHAGWRGACKGIVVQCVTALENLSSLPKTEWKALIGPCVRQENFEVKDDFIAEATALAGDIAPYLSHVPNDAGETRAFFDLPRFVLDALRSAGVNAAIESGVDTFPLGSGYYSHRRSTQAGTSRPSHNFSYIGVK